jgi:septin 3/9/12
MCVEADTVTVIVENGVRLKLNIIDTPGYGDLVNNDGCWEPIVKHVSWRTFTTIQLTIIRSRTSTLPTSARS